MAHPMTRKRVKALRVVVPVLFVVYAITPLVAGWCGIGDYRGPRIYPQSVHRELYILAWEMAGHDEGKPRVSWQAGPRPWFYTIP